MTTDTVCVSGGWYLGSREEFAVRVWFLYIMAGGLTD